VGRTSTYRTTAPAKLRPFVHRSGILVHPFDLALAKMCYNTSGPSDELLRSVRESFSRHLPPSTVRGPAQLDVALNGVDGFVKPLDLSTSAGGFLSSNRWVPFDKEHFVYRDAQELILPRPLLVQWVQAYTRTPSLRPDVATVLKDERLPLEKAADGLSRLFCIFPFPFLVYARTWSVPLLVHYARYHFESGCLVGISPFGRDFHRLAEHLLVFQNPRFWCPDYKAYEYSIPKNVGEETHRFFASLFPPGDRSGYLDFADRILNVRVVGDRYVIYRRSGTTSGNPLTLCFNSTTNRFIIRAALVSICQYKGYPEKDLSLDEYCSFVHANVRDGYFGDDHLLVLNFDLLPVEPSEVAALLATWNMVYTSGDKKSELCSFTSLGDCTFLKRTFWKNSAGTWAGLLSPPVIFETLQWHHTQQHKKLSECVDAVYLSMMEEISLYGKPAAEFYKQYTDYIYTRYFRRSPPLFDPIKRAIELDMFSTSSPDFFFVEFVLYHKNLDPEDSTPMYQYLEQHLDGAIYHRAASLRL